jgi:hypothetical protein
LEIEIRTWLSTKSKVFLYFPVEYKECPGKTLNEYSFGVRSHNVTQIPAYDKTTQKVYFYLVLLFIILFTYFMYFFLLVVHRALWQYKSLVYQQLHYYNKLSVSTTLHMFRSLRDHHQGYLYRAYTKEWCGFNSVYY